ncbi:hypothetical protein EUX98_g670 [Antrodiella citrinella]|uniref:Rhomboid-type serine protease n=1 Tax=Antrodiella citrinella TaxID=2447956 RepID=A0A4S4N550_9APHY|nr:hypothetical protein EUX98_g670 [Antrodiella citrinella]
MTGGVGFEELSRFYKYHFTQDNVTPPDTELITVSRTVGADRIIDEMIYKCTHTTEIDYFLPGITPTGKPLEIALVGVVAFRGDKLTFEHIYWDQASTLVQATIPSTNTRRGMTTPEDAPFNHETIVRHGRTESRTNLLHNDSYEGVKDGSYDPSQAEAGYGYNPSEYNLNDKQNPAVYSYGAHPTQPYSDMAEIVEPYDAARTQAVDEKPPSSVARALGFSSRFLAQRIEDKKRGVVRQRRPYAVYVLTTAMLGVLIYELVLNSKNQGTPISFHPVVNPLLGPSSSALINAGARFPPCMTTVQGLPLDTQFPCLNDTANPPDRLCPLEEVCGFGGFHNETPDQWFRFITPIFLHAGIIHFILNMFAQLTAAAEIEREMGSAGFLIVYFAAGIFGNVLGSNFSLVGVPSVGASGAIFDRITRSLGLISWLIGSTTIDQVGRRLAWMVVELIIAFAVGYIPFVDNFAHIGGFLMGLLTGMVLYPIISATTRHRTIVWALRGAALAVAVVLFVVLIRNFYTSDPYSGVLILLHP